MLLSCFPLLVTSYSYSSHNAVYCNIRLCNNARWWAWFVWFSWFIDVHIYLVRYIIYLCHSLHLKDNWKVTNNNRLIWTCNVIVQILYPYTWVYTLRIKDAFPLTYNSKESIIYIFFKDASVNDAQDIQHTMPLEDLHEELKRRSLMPLSSKNNISHSWVGLYNITSSLL